MDMHERVEAERQRQLWLQALGLPCWVARNPLPAAAESPLLKEAPPAPSARSTPVQARAEQSTVDVSMGRATPPPDKRTASDVVQDTHKSIGAFTLRAFNTRRHWLVVQQSVAQAEHYSPQERQVLNNLLRLWTVDEHDMRSLRFTPKILDPAEMLKGFMYVLSEEKPRFLFLIEEPLNQILTRGPRYQSGKWGDASILVVSSLREMLAEPAEHKRRSWDAMKQAGFDA